ncbi:hypothetical protein NT6N_25520 [Oceaniferula spumae]|uniref:Uncharacterized protein n=1 Tax=Oceaniferula spumae TaxID=2979115 RepID=A0AAT9FNG8_9BACT
MRVVFPLAFLLVAAALVLVVLQAVGFVNLWDFKTGSTPTAPPTPKPTAPSEVKSDVQPDVPAPDATPNPESIQTPSPAAPTPPPKPVTEPAPPTAPGEFPDLAPPPAPGGVSSKPPAAPGAATSPQVKNPPKAGSLVEGRRFLANEILDQFLSAKTLEERLPLMTKSTRSHEDLKKSCLAGPLKTVKSNYFAEMVPRLEDDMRQYLYYVSFEDKTEIRERLLMVVQVVERPGIHPPRVHADAFIEHYEKLLENYAEKPTEKITTFHCIAEARTADLVKNLPEELKSQMIRLEIKSHPRGEPAFDAFLSKNSPLMDRIGPRGDFPYVEPRFCVLSFRWNTKNAEHKFIELTDIVTLGWEK